VCRRDAFCKAAGPDLGHRVSNRPNGIAGEHGFAQRLSPLIAACGVVAVPALLVRHQARLHLSNAEVIYLLHVLSYRWDGTHWPWVAVSAVADAVGLRLKRLAADAQVLVVTHSPQVAARAEAHWRIAKAGEGARLRTAEVTPQRQRDAIDEHRAGGQQPQRRPPSAGDRVANEGRAGRQLRGERQRERQVDVQVHRPPRLVTHAAPGDACGGDAGEDEQRAFSEITPQRIAADLARYTGTQPVDDHGTCIRSRHIFHADNAPILEALIKGKKRRDVQRYHAILVEAWRGKVPFSTFKRVTVDGYNGSGTGGLSADVSRDLVAMGYRAGAVEDSSAQSQPAGAGGRNRGATPA